MKLKKNHASVTNHSYINHLAQLETIAYMISNVGEPSRKASVTESLLMVSSFLDKWHFYVGQLGTQIPNDKSHIFVFMPTSSIVNSLQGKRYMVTFIISHYKHRVSLQHSVTLSTDTIEGTNW